MPITPKRFGGVLRVVAKLNSEILEEQFRQPREGDGIRAANLRVEPVAPAQECGERRGVLPDQRRCLDEVAAVADEIPILREASHPLHRGEADELVL